MTSTELETLETAFRNDPSTIGGLVRKLMEERQHVMSDAKEEEAIRECLRRADRLHDATMLIRRLVRRLGTDDPVAVAASDWLKRNDTPSITREVVNE